MMKGKPLISVAVLLRGRDLNPDFVSKVLGVQPTRFQKRGEPKDRSKKLVAKIGLWSLKVKSEERPLSDLIDELLRRIGDQPIRLSAVGGVEDARLDILFAFDDSEERETVEFTLTEKQIAKLSQLGLSVSVTVS